MLRAACKARGMEHLCHRGGEAALEATVRQLKNEDTPKDFDPLLQANWMIFGRALDLGGLYMMSDAEDGSERCPVCEPIKHLEHTYTKEYGAPIDRYPTMEAHWIDGVMDAVLDIAREKNLMPKAS
jgi:hypothetical protein